MKKFLAVVADALKNDVNSKITEFRDNNNGVLIIGCNKWGEMWANRLEKNGVTIIGFCDYGDKSNDGIRFDSILKNKWNVVICSIDFDVQSEIAYTLSANKIKYIDLTYVINNRFHQHYNVDEIMMNIDNYYKAYELLSDEQSKETYLSLLNYKITRDPLVLNLARYPQYFHPLVRPEKKNCIIEAGGFDGETAIQIAKYIEDQGKIISFEPDIKNLDVMKENLSSHNIGSVMTVPVGLWNKEGNICFLLDGSASIISEYGKDFIPVTTLDRYIEQNDIRLDLLKLDIEGSEAEVIQGAEKVIAFYQPKLQISVYHKANDLWELLLKIHKINPYYKFYLGHHTHFITETVLYAVI